MLGLVRGLHLIHNAPTNSPDDKPLGRHGDIKPENILWFQDEPDPELPECPASAVPGGILKICDFGVTDYHSPLSVSDVPADTVSAATTAYSPPELKRGSTVSPRYDSWSLGCVLLHFVTWYADGWQEGVDAFAGQLRRVVYRVGDLPVVYDGRFFVPDGDGVKLNPAVNKQIERLRKHSNCSSPLFGAVLDVIETKLLRCRTEDRARSDELVEIFEGIYDKCCRPEENDDYLTPRPETVVGSGVEDEEPTVNSSSTGTGCAANGETGERLDSSGPPLLGQGPNVPTPKRRSWGRGFWDFLRAGFRSLSCF